MSQCTCKCTMCEESVQPKEEEQKAKFEPHNIRHARRGIYAFDGQDKEDVVRLLQKAEKQEKDRIRYYMKDSDKKAKLTYEEGGPQLEWGMPQLKREETGPISPVDFGDELSSYQDAGDQALFMWQKLAGLAKGNIEEVQQTKCVKETVIAILGQKYVQMRFDWTCNPDSYLEQFLLINDAKTKISISPLVEIFQAVSKISDENDALTTTCQVVVSKVSSLFE